MTISKETLQALFNFCENVFTDQKDDVGEVVKADKQFQEIGYKKLVSFFETENLTYIASSGKNKSTAKGHNSDDSKYVKVSAQKVKCPLLVKLIWAVKPERKFLRYILVPDEGTIKTGQLDSFIPIYMADTLADYNGDIGQLKEVAAARRIQTEIRNNAAQNAKQKIGKESAMQQALVKQAEDFLDYPEELWIAKIRAKCVAKYSEGFALLVEDLREKANASE